MRTVLVAGCALWLSLFASTVSAATIEQLVSQVSQGRYETYQLTVESMGLGLYGGPGYDQGYRGRDGTAGAGSLGNQEARLYLQDQFAAMGLNVTTQGSYLNVIGELPGLETPEKIYIICGHYDHVGGGSMPGGDDNASGTAGVLEAARVLSQYRFESTIRFIGFNAEEDGLLGSTDYVNNVVVPAGENIAGVINLDMILRPGWDNDPDAVIDIDVTTSRETVYTDWANTFAAAAGAYVPSLTVQHYRPSKGWGYSDHAPFITAGYPAFLLIENSAPELWGGANIYYHTSEDWSGGLANDPSSPSGVVYDYAFATDVVRATVATISQGAQFAAVPEPMTLLTLSFSIVLVVRRRRAA